jgi:hypothetical protein
VPSNTNPDGAQWVGGCDHLGEVIDDHIATKRDFVRQRGVSGS